LPLTGQRSVTFTTTEWNGPVYAGEYGSSVPVKAKHRPHASPAPKPGADPKESWLIAAVKPEADIPQAGEPHPEYMVNVDVPDVVCTQPPVARFSTAVAPVNATRETVATSSEANILEEDVARCRGA